MRLLPIFVIVVWVIILIIQACNFPKEIQLHREYLEVVEIKEIHRYPNTTKAMITWANSEGVIYIEFKDLPITERIGDRAYVLIPK